MKKIISFIAVLTLLLGLSGCSGSQIISGSDEDISSDAENPPAMDEPADDVSEAEGEDAETAEEPAPEPEGEKGYVLVDGLRIRKNPNVDASIVDTLNLGAEIGILEKSETPQKIGDYEDYWYHIRFGDKNGWAFGPYVSSQEDVSGKVQARFDRYFTADLSIVNAVATLEKLIDLTGDSGLADMGVLKIRQLQKDVDYRYMQTLGQKENVEKLRDIPWESLNDPEKIADVNLRDIITTIKANGYHIFPSEGDFYLESDPQYFLQRFGSQISKPLKEYLNLQTVEVNQHISEDAAMLISWDALSDRIAGWENYIHKYPDTTAGKMAKEEYFLPYLSVYVHGMDNSDLYEYETRELLDVVKKSYERYINKYGSQPSGKAILGLYNLLKQNDFKAADEVAQYADNINEYLN